MRVLGFVAAVLLAIGICVRRYEAFGSYVEIVDATTGKILAHRETTGRGAVAFPLRTDSPPKEWKLDQINACLPRRWDSGTVHILAWEMIEDKGEDRNRQTAALS